MSASLASRGWLSRPCVFLLSLGLDAPIAAGSEQSRADFGPTQWRGRALPCGMPSLLVALAALLFSIVSFWWLQARRGKLKMSSIPAFSGHIAHDGRIALRLPVLLYNTGARTRVVDELRLVIPSWDHPIGDWQTFHSTLEPRSGPTDRDDFAGPYAIDGRRAVMRFVKFTHAVGARLPEPAATPGALEARLDGSDDWETVAPLTIYLAHMAHPEIYGTYRNRAAPCEGEPESTKNAWTDLAQKRGMATPWS